jgi:hypothetical protein
VNRRFCPTKIGDIVLSKTISFSDTGAKIADEADQLVNLQRSMRSGLHARIILARRQ